MFNASLLDQEAIKQSEQNNSLAENIRLASHKGGRGKFQKKWKDKTSQLDSACNKTCTYDYLSKNTTMFENADECTTSLKFNTLNCHATKSKTFKQRKDVKKISSIGKYV